MNDLLTIQVILQHHADNGAVPPRIASINVSGTPTIRLRDDDIATFRAWVTSLSAASPVHGDLRKHRAVLSCTGLISCGRRVSVAVDVRAELLRRNDLAGFISAHELARLAPMVMNS